MLRRNLTALAAALMLGAAAGTVQAEWPGERASDASRGRWVACDFHQHTMFTDGSNTMKDDMTNGFKFGLGWAANSEHGGSSSTDEKGHRWDDPNYYPVNPIIGDGLHQSMWRWQELRDFAFPIILDLRSQLPGMLVASGLEWNIPGHEHCSTGIVAKNASGIAQFEWKFDKSDKDLTGGALQGWSGKSNSNIHANAVAGAAWMAANYPNTSWIVPAHPERASSYKIEHFRDLNNAAPTVAFGFEGMPGHQKEPTRGSYGSGAVGGGTYGGAGYYIAKVGGLWDAMLGEGRHWWTFVSSDFHSTAGDFWPGEYAKTWAFVPDSKRHGGHELEDVVDGLRSGNSFSVHGDLINALDFSAQHRSDEAGMGQDIRIPKGSTVKIKIRFKSPKVNNHGDAPVVDHIDLIAGKITGMVAPSDPNYTKDTNETTRVIARFTSSDWERDEDGWKTVVYHLSNMDSSTYFRLRGTNLAPNTALETDAAGNPLLDAEAGPNTVDAVWKDLWFYSNPVFVYVK